MAYIRCDDKIHAKLKVAAAKVQRPMQDIAEELLLSFVESVEAGRPPSAGDAPGKSPEGKHTDSQSGPVLQEISGGAGAALRTWEYEALGEILDSGYGVCAEAIQKNLTAFRELVRRIADERAHPSNAKAERVPDGKVEEVPVRTRELRAAYEVKKRDLQRHPEPRKGKREPEEGTA